MAQIAGSVLVLAGDPLVLRSQLARILRSLAHDAGDSSDRRAHAHYRWRHALSCARHRRPLCAVGTRD